MATIPTSEENEELPAIRRDEAEELVKLFIATDTEQPDKEQLAKLKDTLQAYPQMGEIIINLNLLVEVRIIDKLLENDAGRETLIAVLRAKRIELGYDIAPAIERALIEHLVLCWLRFQEVSHQYQSQMEKQPSFISGVYWEKRLTSAHTRYLQAIESLARVRRLAVRTPTLMQVNIGINN